MVTNRLSSFFALAKGGNVRGSLIALYSCMFCGKSRRLQKLWAGGMGLHKVLFLVALPLGIANLAMNVVQLCQAFVERFDEKQAKQHWLFCCEHLYVIKLKLYLSAVCLPKRGKSVHEGELLRSQKNLK